MAQIMHVRINTAVTHLLLRTTYMYMYATSFCLCSSSSSPSSSSRWTVINEPDNTTLPENLGPGDDICDFVAYVVDPLHPFDNEAVFEGATVELRDFSTWWYTSTLGQDAEAASEADLSAPDSDSASVLLGDPGVYVACLVPRDEDCIATDCVEFLVHQPNRDFFQVI